MARDILDGSRVVFKRFADGETSQLRREVGALQRLKHPLVLSLIGAFVDGRETVLVLPYIAGGHLGTWLFGARYTHLNASQLSPLLRVCPAEQVLSVLRQVLQGLAYCHRMGVVHRDVKPSNILMDSHANGTPKPLLADFDVSTASMGTRFATATTKGLVGTIGVRDLGMD